MMGLIVLRSAASRAACEGSCQLHKQTLFERKNRAKVASNAILCRTAQPASFSTLGVHALWLYPYKIMPTAETPQTAQSGETSSAHLLQRAGLQKLPSEKLALFQLRNFLNAAQCEQLITLIEAERRPSTIADANGDDYFRTSETCDLDMTNSAVAQLDAMLTSLSGIDPAHGEPLQGQRYDVGQEFKAHTDYFSPEGADYAKFCSVAGQRTWTFMIYLNEPEAGGATRFKAIKKSFQPETGKLLCWNNRREDLSVNPNTLHHGMKVRKGLKYVITKWYREKPWGWE